MSQRNQTIDIAKGISIILIVFAHAKIRKFFPEFDNLLDYFRLPFFFLISGVFFKHSLSWGNFLLRKSDGLLKPYFVTGIILILIFVPWANFALAIPNMFFGNSHNQVALQWGALWFLPHLWLTSVFVFSIFRLTNLAEKNILIRVSFVVLLLAAGLWSFGMFYPSNGGIFGPDFKKGLPFSADLLLMSSAFFISGNFLKEQVIKFKPNFIIILILVLSSYFILEFSITKMDFNHRIIRNPLTLIISASGIYIFMCLAYWISKVPYLRSLFLMAGISSLFILIFHSFLEKHLFILLKRDLQFGLLFSKWASFFLCIAASILIREIVKKIPPLRLLYFPIPSLKNKQS